MSSLSLPNFVSATSAVFTKNSISILCYTATQNVVSLKRYCFRSYDRGLIIIIIIINFYGAYILRNLSSEAQQNRLIKHNPEQGRANVIIRTSDNRGFMVEMQFGINMS